MRELRLSASSIMDFKECQHRYLLSKVYGLQPIGEKDSQRIGTVWHKCHELSAMAPHAKCPDCLKKKELQPDCLVCSGTGRLPDEPVINYVNNVYEHVPENKSHDDWAVERIKVLWSFSGYRWLYGDDSPFVPVASEVWFNIPIIDPEKHRKLPKIRLVGKIDQIVQHKKNGLYYVFERKSTSQSLNSGQYWRRIAMDTQVSTYLYGSRIAQRLGQLEQYGIMPTDPLIEGVFYDVWHKPDISPKKLVKKDIHVPDSCTNILYYGEEFQPSDFDANFETPEMYGARLLQDISERPEHYFQQKEISRADDELEAFERELCNIAKQIKMIEKDGLWCRNERSCEVPFYCDFRSICQNHVNVGPADIPDGFTKREEKKDAKTEDS